MRIIGFDQSTEKTGFAVIQDDIVLELGTIITPKKLDVEARIYQAFRLNSLLLRVRTTETVLGIEGTFLQGHGQKHNVSTLQNLDRLAGALEYIGAVEGIAVHTIQVHEVTRYCGLPPNTIRFAKKQAALLTARYILQAAGWDRHADALRHASDMINEWNPNTAGQTKTSEALLTRLDKWLFDEIGCTTDTADALIIAEITQAKVKQAELMG